MAAYRPTRNGQRRNGMRVTTTGNFILLDKVDKSVMNGQDNEPWASEFSEEIYSTSCPGSSIKELTGFYLFRLLGSNSLLLVIKVSSYFHMQGGHLS